MTRALDVHVALDDGFALCGGNKEPRVPLDMFILYSERLKHETSRRWPWQCCPRCLALISD